jgi:multicomponent K+:H+ antiporter subunit F
MTWFAFVLPVAMGAFALAMLLNGWRLLRGPSLADRLLALDTLFVNMLAFLILAGIDRNTQLYFEVSLLIALLGFVGTIAVSKYVLRGNIVD